MEKSSEAVILDGKKVATKWKEDIAQFINEHFEADQRPTLAVVTVGSDEASKVYVRNKKRACKDVGIEYREITLESDISQDKLELSLAQLSMDPNVNGIILQLPIPEHLNAVHAIEFINVNDPLKANKDVDGLGHDNIGWLSVLPSNGLQPCTPLGIMRLLDEYGVFDSERKPGHAVIVGRSNLVGKPLIQMLLRKNWTVTVCHSHTEDLTFYTKQADLLIVAVGKPNLVTNTMVKPGATVVDVGINRVDGKLCGDVDFDSVKAVAGAITPVPGGVGAMTVAALMYNTVKAAVYQEILR